MIERFEIVVSEGARRTRLEDYLFSRFGELSRMYLREVVRNGGCEVNGRHENIGYRLRPRDLIEIEVDLSRGTAMRPEDLPLDIVFEDEDLLVVIKPAGMLVHPTHRDKNGTLLNALSFHLNKEAEERNGVPTPKIRPGLIHRLDKETSGLMVVAKNVRSHRILAKQFQRKTVSKIYLALVEGVVKDDEGTIEYPIGRFPDKKLWDIKADGKEATSRFKVLDRDREVTLLELEPITGRTNQLRIHCKYFGHPIVGDTGRGGSKAERLMLHAYRLGFRHPQNNVLLEFSYGAPKEFRQTGKPESS